jgi:TetR/AcrR family transcriptional regulator, transcriptional repressor for nem operon
MSRGKSRDQLLEQGLSLFSTRGYAATGVQDITDAAGVPKGSFYNYFGSKEEFAIAVLDRYRAAAQLHFTSALADGHSSPLKRLRHFLEESARTMADSGFTESCLAGRLAQELAGENVAFRKPLCQVFSSMRNLVTACLVEARDKGELALDEDAEALADFLVNSWQGAMLRAKTAASAQPLNVALDLFFRRILLAPSSESTKLVSSNLDSSVAHP